MLVGSVRKAGNRIRATAQLVEAESGKHVWAEHYDRDLADIFAVQDEITDAVTVAVAPAIDDAERRRAMRKAPESLDVWAAYQRGVSWGSAFAAIAWLAASALFSWYAASFGSFNKTYGSLGAIIGFMLWMWLSIIVVLVGGKLKAEIEHQTARETTAGRPKPLSRRSAKMADTIGPARA